MDAVELPFPVDVVVAPKLMGPSEGFLRAGVTVKELEASKSERVSVLDGSSIEPCSSFLSEKGNFNWCFCSCLRVILLLYVKSSQKYFTMFARSLEIICQVCGRLVFFVGKKEKEILERENLDLKLFFNLNFLLLPS